MQPRAWPRSMTPPQPPEGGTIETVHFFCSLCLLCSHACWAAGNRSQPVTVCGHRDGADTIRVAEPIMMLPRSGGAADSERFPWFFGLPSGCGGTAACGMIRTRGDRLRGPQLHLDSCHLRCRTSRTMSYVMHVRHRTCDVRHRAEHRTYDVVRTIYRM